MKKHTKECDGCVSIENQDICFDNIEEMMDYEKSQRPWYIAKWEDWIYYPVYRTIYWKIWNNIRPSTIKHYYQRAKYGYSYQDNWGIDYHLVMILIPMLENLRKNHSGISLAFYKKSDGVDKDGNPSDIADKKAEQRMYNILGEMIYGLKCAKLIHDLNYNYTDKNEFNKLNKAVKRTFKLMGEYFFSLWD